MPFSPSTTYAPGSTPAIKAQDLDDLQTYLTGLLNAILSLKKLRIDGTGEQAVAPTALLELAAAVGVYLPEFATLDPSGRARFMFDHNGFPTAYGFGEFWEQWNIAPGASGAALASSLAAGAALAVQAPNTNYAARFLQVTPSTAAGAGSQSIANGPSGGLIYTGANQSVVMELDVGLNAAAAGIASNVGWFWGFDVGVDPFNTSESFIGIAKPNSSAHYQLQISDGVHLIALTDLGVTPTTSANSVPVDRLKLEYHGAASAAGIAAGGLAVVKVWVNPTSGAAPLATVVAGNGGNPFFPASALKVLLGSYNQSGAPSGSPLGWIGPVNVCWNRVLAPALL